MGKEVRVVLEEAKVRSQSESGQIAAHDILNELTKASLTLKKRLYILPTPLLMYLSVFVNKDARK